MTTFLLVVALIFCVGMVAAETAEQRADEPAPQMAKEQVHDRVDRLAREGSLQGARLDKDYPEFAFAAMVNARSRAETSGAADGGEAAASYAALLELGLWAPVDLHQAQQWYLVAAHLGHQQAQRALTIFYSGYYHAYAEPDFVQLEFWLVKLAERGDELAHWQLSELNKHLKTSTVSVSLHDGQQRSDDL